MVLCYRLESSVDARGIEQPLAGHTRRRSIVIVVAVITSKSSSFSSCLSGVAMDRMSRACQSSLKSLGIVVMERSILESYSTRSQPVPLTFLSRPQVTKVRRVELRLVHSYR